MKPQARKSMQRVHDFLSLHGWHREKSWNGAYGPTEIGNYHHPEMDLSTISVRPIGNKAAWRHYHGGSGEMVDGHGIRRLQHYLQVVHGTGGDITKLGRQEGMDIEAMIQERTPRRPVFRQAAADLMRPKKRPRFTRYSEDTFVKANVDPRMDIPEHHKLLTRFGFTYLDAMPESLEKGNTEYIHSYVHEKDGQIIVSSSGAWNMHMPHAQEESVPPGPGTWLSLETVLRRNYKMVESLDGSSGFGAIYQHYYDRGAYGQIEDPHIIQEVPPQTPTEVEKSIDQVLAGLSTREAIHALVHNKETM